MATEETCSACGAPAGCVRDDFTGRCVKMTEQYAAEIERLHGSEEADRFRRMRAGLDSA